MSICASLRTMVLWCRLSPETLLSVAPLMEIASQSPQSNLPSVLPWHQWNPTANLAAAVTTFTLPKISVHPDGNHSIQPHPPRWAPKLHTNLDFFFTATCPSPESMPVKKQKCYEMKFIVLRGITHKLSSPLTFCMSNFFSFVLSYIQCPETVL